MQKNKLEAHASSKANAKTTNQLNPIKDILKNRTLIEINNRKSFF